MYDFFRYGAYKGDYLIYTETEMDSMSRELLEETLQSLKNKRHSCEREYDDFMDMLRLSREAYENLLVNKKKLITEIIVCFVVCFLIYILKGDMFGIRLTADVVIVRLVMGLINLVAFALFIYKIIQFYNIYIPNRKNTFGEKILSPILAKEAEIKNYEKKIEDVKRYMDRIDDTMHKVKERLQAEVC